MLLFMLIHAFNKDDLYDVISDILSRLQDINMSIWIQKICQREEIITPHCNNKVTSH